MINAFFSTEKKTTPRPGVRPKNGLSFDRLTVVVGIHGEQQRVTGDPVMARRKRHVPYRKEMAKSPLARFLTKKAGLETVCQRCSGLYVEGPAPVPVDQIHFGSAVVSVYKEERFGRQYIYLSLGRSRAAGHRIKLSEYLDVTDIDDAMRALWQARKVLTGSNKIRA